jgi:hypothetical protein
MPFPRALAAAAAGTALAAAALAAGCTPEGEFPSLAVRPIESEDPLVEPVRAPPVVAPDPALRARAAELLAEAHAGDRAFAATLGPARTAARSAGAPGAESWVVAQQAISRAEAARSVTTRALAELDRLSVERAAVATNADDFAAIRRALAEAQRVARAQQQRIDALRAEVRR